LISALKRITTEHFHVYFHLWKDGGPNWRKEFWKWEEEENSWTLVSRKRKSKSGKFVHFVSPLRQKSPPFKHSSMLVSHALKLGVLTALLIRIRLLFSSPAFFKTTLVFQSLRYLGPSRTSFLRWAKKITIQIQFQI
jgi:hypothetical protein